MNEKLLVRTQRLKQAKDEAEREAAQYRSHMEEEYQKSLTEVYMHTHLYMDFICMFSKCFYTYILLLQILKYFHKCVYMVRFD